MAKKKTVRAKRIKAKDNLALRCSCGRGIFITPITKVEDCIAWNGEPYRAHHALVDDQGYVASCQFCGKPWRVLLNLPLRIETPIANR